LFADNPLEAGPVRRDRIIKLAKGKIRSHSGSSQSTEPAAASDPDYGSAAVPGAMQPFGGCMPQSRES